MDPKLPEMPVTVINSAKTQIGENRFAIFLVTVISAAASLGPIGFVTDSASSIPWFLGAAVVLAIWRVTRLAASAVPPPSRTFLEYLLATLVAAFSYQISLVIGFIPAAVLFAVLQLVNTVGSWFGASWHLPAWKIAWWIGAIGAAFFVWVGTSLAVERARA